MKIINIILMFSILFLAMPQGSESASEALETIKVPVIYPYQVEQYARDKFKFDLSKLKYSDERINAEAASAGWGAFKDNCDLQGAAFTIGEECLSMGFLKGINGIMGEIGGGMVVLQLMIDLASGDYRAAVLNVSEGSILYAIGKWGTKTMKVTAVAYTVTKLSLIKIYKTFREYHDEFFYRALRHYFTRGGGKRNSQDWLNDFSNYNNGQGVKTQEDVMAVVDNYINQLWDPDEFYFALGEVKDEAGPILERYPTKTFEKNKQHFVDFVKAVIIFPYLEPVLKRVTEENVDKESKAIIRDIKELAAELNKVYTFKGVVKGGPQDKVSGLSVEIPNFLNTTTNFAGQFQFKFTLYSLLKSRQPLDVKLYIPTKDGGTRTITKSGKITTKHRKTGVITVKFDLTEGKIESGDMDADTFYGLYCRTALKIQPLLYSSMDKATYNKMCESGQGVFNNEGQCVAYYTKLENDATAVWRRQGEGPERIKQGLDAFRKLFKMALTRDGCKKFYGGFMGGLYGLSKSAGENEAEREANFQRARREMMNKMEGICNKLPERLDW